MMINHRAYTSLERLLWILVIVFGSAKSADAEYFRHINLSQGLSQPSVMAINQDKLGRMWFGTREGINIFDGMNMTSYKGWVENPSTGNKVWIGNEVESIVTDSIGNLYLLIDNDIAKYDINADRFTNFTTSGNIRALTALDGEIAYIAGDSIFMKETSSDIVHYQFSVPGLNAINDLNMSATHIIAATERGLHTYDRKTRRHKAFLETIPIYSTFLSNDKTLWISARNSGMYKMTESNPTPVSASVLATPTGVIGAQQTRRAVEDQFGRIWYGSFTGLFCYDPATDNTSQIQMPQNIGGLNHSSIFGMYRDKQGTIWVGSYYGGVNYFTPSHDRYFNYDYDKVSPSGLFHSIVIDLATDRNNNLWFGTDGAGVCCVDSTWTIVKQLSTKSGKNALRQNNIKTLAYDPESNRIFIGTHLGGLSYYDIDEDRTVNFIDGKKIDCLGDVILDLKVKGNYLYISSRKGVCRMNLRTGAFTPLLTDRSVIGYKLILSFDFDNNDNMYMLDESSVYMIRDLDKIPSSGVANQTDNVERILSDVKLASSILCTDSALVIGSLGWGLYYLPTGADKVTRLSTFNSQLPNDYCYALQKGGDNEIYIASDHNIVRFNTADKTFTKLYFADYFPESHIIAESGFMYHPNGHLYVGSTKGITVLNKENFGSDNQYDREMPPFYLSHLSVLNRDIKPNDNSGILNCALPFAKEIRLKPYQNSFSLMASTSDYVNTSGAHTFRYMLDGVDNDWLTTDNGRIHYTNLSSGTYTLHVRRPESFAPLQSETDQEIELKVIVERPWFATWWAWLIYLTIIGVIVYFLIIKTRDFARLKLSLKREKIERQQIEKLNHEKLVFFTNVSHEFQTPLTLIMSHIDLMLARAGRNERLTTALSRVRVHAEQLSHLITQLMEFRKLQQNRQTLKIGHHNAAMALKKTTDPFIEHAEKRGIKFVVRYDDPDAKGWFDPWLTDRVLVNIVSNAFKYTPDGGQIECSMSTDKNGNIVFRCTDNGKGISEQDLPYIFDRFYNGSADQVNYSDINYKSTGIGLAFAKTIVDRHHGTIQVDSSPESGSTFTVTLPGDKSVFDNDSNIEFDTMVSEADVQPTDTKVVMTQEALIESEPEYSPEENSSKPTVLVVEDNDELRNNLSQFFSTYYSVIQACDGVEGLEKARMCDPDIIVSDVLMPNMDGVQMCRAIKSDVAICHIPVILLTALSATESRFDGLNANADDYVTKPYESSLLLARVDNLLRNRQILRNQFEKRPVSEIDISVVNPIDRDILKRTSEIIDAHISDPDFDIPQLCRELAVSKSLFYTKFKSLTGMTPNAFILNHRLKHAAALLTAQPHMSVTDVADKTGFTTTVYFSRCFKKQFGVPPQKYRTSETAIHELST